MPALPQEVIAKKRDGIELDASDITEFVIGITSGTVDDAQIAAFAMAVYFQGMTLDERVALTLAMRDSGRVLDWTDLEGPTIDKHSTGGVGDNVSLMLAPILAASGAYVPMISGRGLGHTGGTLDKFDAIPGYMTNPDIDTLKRVVKQVGCAIIGQTNDLAPADRRVYSIRDVTATVEDISLITASILSKKLAAGLDALILDVKTGSGAFMDTLADSIGLAESLVAVANGAGLKTGALITDMNQPLASAAGNWLEVKNAIDFLTGIHRDPRLQEATLALCAHGLVLGGMALDIDDGLVRAQMALDSGAAAEKFFKMANALGSWHDLETYTPEPAAVIRDVFPTSTGSVTHIEVRKVGMAIVVLGGGRAHPGQKIDYRVGLDRLAGIGAKVSSQEPIARIHANDVSTAAEAEKRLIAAYRIGENAAEHPVIYSEILPQGGQ
ncbi:thymidine phosphorylase [Pelagibacterium sp.]|uniref:thymidine phosphorylase n=1 Tax=Pelagibacterium sp. TaxID=1967288 RepID=UPI003A90CA82